MACLKGLNDLHMYMYNETNLQLCSVSGRLESSKKDEKFNAP